MKLEQPNWNTETYLEFINSRLSKHGLWVGWLILLAMVCLIHSLTLTISPPLWGDEVQIIEHGRIIPFQPNSEWSMNWWSRANRPILLWSYLGPALQEGAFKITMPLPTGPRVASLLGAMMAATTSVGWLLAMKTYRPVALVLGLIFLLDPIFVPSYRGGRVDCWALAVCFGSCWVLRRAMSRMENGRPFRWVLMLAGSLASVAFFIWPSAVLTYPLVLAELTALFWEGRRMKSGASALPSLAAFAVGGLAMASVMFIPIRHLLKDVLYDVQPILSASQPPYSFWIQVKAFLDSLKYSQLLPVGALIGFICGRGRVILYMALFAFVYVFSTRLYPGRLIYLLPYAIGLIGAACRVPLSFNSKTCRVVTQVGLAMVLMTSVSSSLIIRPVVALDQKREREPGVLFKLGSESIGDGPHRIYLGAWEFYFVGRKLGWHMFHEYVDQDQTNLSTILSSVDYAIFYSGDVNGELDLTLSNAGLRLSKVLVDDRQHLAGVNHQFSPATKLYGPYRLYSRQPAPDGL